MTDASISPRVVLYAGPQGDRAAPAEAIQALESATVTRAPGEASGFQLSFRLPRGRGPRASDFGLVERPELQPFARVGVAVAFGAGGETLLIDGVVTHRALSVRPEGGATFTLTGEDAGFLMDREVKVVRRSGMRTDAIVSDVLQAYAGEGIAAKVASLPTHSVRRTDEAPELQHGTDRAYLRALAARFGYRFDVAPGTSAGRSVAVWGPPTRTGTPQPALTLAAGWEGNVLDADVTHEAAAGVLVDAPVEDDDTLQVGAVRTTASTREPLSKAPHWERYAARLRKQPLAAPGLTLDEARARAQGLTDASFDRVVTVRGRLDGLRYGRPLAAGGLVGLRGVGADFDGLYEVDSVTHLITRRSYTQSFGLSREGAGAASSTVTP